MSKKIFDSIASQSRNIILFGLFQTIRDLCYTSETILRKNNAAILLSPVLLKQAEVNINRQQDSQCCSLLEIPPAIERYAGLVCISEIRPFEETVLTGNYRRHITTIYSSNTVVVCSLLFTADFATFAFQPTTRINSLYPIFIVKDIRERNSQFQDRVFQCPLSLSTEHHKPSLISVFSIEKVTDQDQCPL